MNPGRRSPWQHILAATLAVSMGTLVGLLVVALDKETRTERLVLVDAEGEERAALEVVEGRVRLTLRGGDRRVVLQADEDAAGLEIHGAHRAAGLVATDGGTMLLVGDESGSKRAAIGYSRAGGAELMLFDGSGRTEFDGGRR